MTLHTQGTTFKRGSGSGPVVYTTVGGVTDCQPPEHKRKANDTTTLDQADNFKHVEGSVLQEFGAVELELLLDPESAQQAQLEADMGTVSSIPYQILYRNGDKEEFNGVVTSYKRTGKMDENFKVKVTIEVDGESVYTEAA